MKRITLFLSLALLLGCQSQNRLTSQLTSLKTKLFPTPDQKQIEATSAAIRAGDVERAEVEASQLTTPFLRSKALGMIAHFQIREQNDLIGAKKTIEKLEATINEVSSKEDKLFAEIVLADTLHFIDRKQSKELLKKLNPEIWSVVSPEDRSELLIRLITLQLESQKNVESAKVTIKQAQETIGFIQQEGLRSLREKELSNVLQVNNHILCQDI